MDFPFSISEPRALLLLLTIPVVVYVGLLSARARPRDRARISASTVLRTLILLLITLAIAGTQFISRGGPLNVVFLVDESASVSQATLNAEKDYVRKAIASMAPEDRAGVVLFGENAIVDRALSADTDWQPGGKQPAQVATNIADAIQVGTALFPEGGSRRLVLLSDGAETVGRARDVAGALPGQGVQLSVVPLGAQSRNEVAIDRVVSPNSVPAGQQIAVRVLVRSNSDRAATVNLFDGDTPVGTQDLAVKAGDNVATFTVQPSTEGFHVFKARVDSVDDQFAQNNEALSYTIVKKPPSVLMLAGSPDDAASMQKALEADGIHVEVAAPDGLPRDPDHLAAYDAVVLANVSAEALTIEGQQALQTYVRDTGHGLVMIGGEHSYGAGGYLRSPLEEVVPVTMDVRTSDERATLAMTFVVDKSGSMGKCHCGGAGQFDPAMRTEFGDSKIEIVKKAISRATSLLNSTDEVGLVTFDAQTHWVAPLQPLGQLGEGHLQELMQPIQAEGATNMAPGISAAIDALEGSNAKLKHIVLLGDGWSKAGSYGPLLDRMDAAHITLSSVGVGDGADQILKELADKGGGQYYAANDIKSVPDVLLRETIRLVGAYFVEQPFKPTQARASPILKGLDAATLPPLQGYNATTLKPDADLILKSPQGDPILAQWQYGLGRVAAWTSDAKGRWATDWVTWPQFARFTGQLVGWTLPSQGTPGLETSFSLAPGIGAGTGSGRGTGVGAQDVLVRIDSSTSTGAPRNFLDSSVVITGTGQVTSTAQVFQRSPGVYDGVAKGLAPGAYDVRIEQRDVATHNLVATEESGFVVPYPSEYRLSPDTGRNAAALMGDLAQLGGGKTLDMAQPDSAFSHDLNTQPQPVALWPMLLLFAMLLFPVDVAVRRISATPHELWRLLRRKEDVR